LQIATINGEEIDGENMAREAALDDLYLGLTTLARRARDVGDELHPGLSLVAYTLLTQVDVTPGMRAADLAAHFCLDKSTVSRQLEQLISAGLLCRDCEQPGRRGYALTLTAAGRQHLDAAGHAVRDRLAERLTDWDDHDIDAFAELVTRFNLGSSRLWANSAPYEVARMGNEVPVRDAQ
jgi:DNA-binding MarR family transcriptional regulator